MTNNQAAKTQPKDWQDKKEDYNQEIPNGYQKQSKDDEANKSLWRPTDNETKSQSENPTGGAKDSPASQTQTGDPGRTPGKAEGEDFED